MDLLKVLTKITFGYIATCKWVRRFTVTLKNVGYWPISYWKRWSFTTKIGLSPIFMSTTVQSLVLFLLRQEVTFSQFTKTNWSSRKGHLILKFYWHFCYYSILKLLSFNFLGKAILSRSRLVVRVSIYKRHY